jgi:hypothetical protein
MTHELASLLLVKIKAFAKMFNIPDDETSIDKFLNKSEKENDLALSEELWGDKKLYTDSVKSNLI